MFPKILLILFKYSKWDKAWRLVKEVTEASRLFEKSLQRMLTVSCGLPRYIHKKNVVFPTIVMKLMNKEKKL